MDKLLEIQNSFVDGTKFNLLDVMGREFVKKGKMTKLSRKGPQRHTFWLFSDVLVYGDRSGVSGQYKVNRVIQLLKCQVTSPSADEIAKMQGIEVEDNSEKHQLNAGELGVGGVRGGGGGGEQESSNAASLSRVFLARRSHGSLSRFALTPHRARRNHDQHRELREELRRVRGRQGAAHPVGQRH